jgi:glycosyltransferase involved in cell wall biosynthesis
MMPDAISLVVCTIGRYSELERLFSSLTRQTFAEFEVVLVDQNPIGFLNPIVNCFRDKLLIRHVRSQPGLSKARNVGIMQAAHNVIAFPDDDCWYAEDGLATAMRLLDGNPALDIIAGRTVDDRGKSSVFSSLNYEAVINKYNSFRCINANAIFVRRSVTAKIAFDERLGAGPQIPFGCGEETDFVLRAIARGHPAKFFPELTVFHPQVESWVVTDRQMQRARLYGGGFGALLRKHKFPSLYVVYRLLRTAYAVLKATLTLRLDWARYKWVWLCAVVRGYVAWPPPQP